MQEGFAPSSLTYEVSVLTNINYRTDPILPHWVGSHNTHDGENAKLIQLGSHLALVVDQADVLYFLGIARP